jgi:uncharacterized membrane protein
VNPFDPRSVLLARHAQHVVLIHFPIALFIASAGFDFAAHWTKKTNLAAVAYYNLLLAAIASVPVVATGIIAWQWQLQGQRLHGILLLHLLSGVVSSVLIWLLLWVHIRGKQNGGALPSYRLVLEALAVCSLAFTAHLGGFLSGVNAG